MKVAKLMLDRDTNRLLIFSMTSAMAAFITLVCDLVIVFCNYQPAGMPIWVMVAFISLGVAAFAGILAVCEFGYMEVKNNFRLEFDIAVWVALGCIAFSWIIIGMTLNVLGQ